MAEQKILNGVNVGQLFSTIEWIRKNPEVAKFKFRARNKWIQGTHNRPTVNGFYGALKEDTSRDPMIFDLDEPPVLLGKNQGANPVEVLLVALSGCLTTSMVAHAAARGIEIKGVHSRYEGDLDLRGFLGISEDVKAGYQEIRVYFKIDGNLSDPQKEELIRIAQKYSPVFNTLARSAPVTVQLEKENPEGGKI
ncbi:MAG: OsmC family protein [Planctomycetaceae bacterium]